MKILTDISAPLQLRRPVITIGTFDGVHAGHRVILNEAVKLAAARGTDSAVVTFNPHPRIVLGQEVSLLNTREEKRSIIEGMGFTHLVEIPFTLKFSDMEAHEFIKLLSDRINPSVVIIGYDHGFGRNRSGDIQQLTESGREYGFEVINVDAVEYGDQKVSSSIIRTLLMKGDVKKAGQLLCMPYEMTGSVIRGNQIGRRIGYPTANLYIDDKYKLIPAMGVYASLVKHNNRTYRSMSNIGIRPTISTHNLTIEANIFDFDEDIYYEKITLTLIDRIRDELKFESLDALKEQLILDKEDTLKILKGFEI